MLLTEQLGVPVLDRLLAPLPPGSRLLLANEPGIDPSPFMQQASDARLADGRPVLYVSCDRAPLFVRTSYGRRAGDLLIVDAHSGSLGQDPAADFHLESPGDLAEFEAVLRQAHRIAPDALVLIDSLSTLLDIAEPVDPAAAVGPVMDALRQFPLSVAAFTRWPYASSINAVVDLFDGVVSLDGMRGRTVFGRTVQVRRADWKPNGREQAVAFKVARNRVLEYIPKIVVTGPFHAGKSSFVRTVSDSSISVNRGTTTVALDHGHAILGDLDVDVYGTPGQGRFDSLLAPLSAQAMGIVLVVDATKPYTFRRAAEMLAVARTRDVPVVVAANKQDAPHALSPEEVAARLAFPPRVKVLPCVATEAAACRAILLQLVAEMRTLEVVA